MAREFRRLVNGVKMTRLEAIAYYHKLAVGYPEPEKSHFLEELVKEFDYDRKMENKKSKWESWGQGIVGLLLLGVTLYIAIAIPNPTQYQRGVFWVVASIAAGASAFFLTGTIEYTNKLGIKAVGGCAIFAIMFFGVPKMANMGSTENAKLSLFVVMSDTGAVQKFTADYNATSQQKITDVAIAALAQYTGPDSLRHQSYTCYRKSDGKIYSDETCASETEKDVMMIALDVIKKLNGKRAAYLHYKLAADAAGK